MDWLYAMERVIQEADTRYNDLFATTSSEYREPVVDGCKAVRSHDAEASTSRTHADPAYDCFNDNRELHDGTEPSGVNYLDLDIFTSWDFASWTDPNAKNPP